MLSIKSILPLFLFVFFIEKGFSQSFTVNGTTQKINNSECYKLTSAQNWQNGSVWFSDKLDLSKTFDLEFYLNFGTNDGGADGIVFVIQTLGTSALGNNGGSIGFEGFSPALGVEFDDYENPSINDPSHDHIALVKNGSVAHPTGSSIYSPVSALTNKGNIEDGKDHLVRITWNPAGFQLEVFFDCVSRLKISNLDIVKTILNNKSDVWWGFTSATGGENNNQTVCIENSVFRKKIFETCDNTSIILTTGKSINNVYSWSPSTFLSATNIKTPLCTPNKDIQYIVSYKDKCNKDVKDTIRVKTILKPVVKLPNDTSICIKDSLLLKPNVKNSYSFWYWSHGSKIFNSFVKNNGLFWFEAYNSCGTHRDSIVIKQIPQPLVILGSDTSICKGDTLSVKPKWIGVNSTFKWNDEFGFIQRKLFKQGLYFASIQNQCGTGTDSIRLSILQPPTINIGNDTILCPGEDVNITPKTGGFYTLNNWGDAFPRINRTISNPQKVWFIVSGPCGLATDTMNVSYVNLMPLKLGNDTSICKKDSLFLNINSFNRGIPLWNDGFKGYQRKINKEGIYIANTTQQKCNISDTIEVFIDNSPFFSGIRDTTGCINMAIEYFVDKRNTKAIWDGLDFSFDKKYLNMPGKHWVEVEAKCGMKTDTFSINLIECVCDFWIPSAISSNNQDQLNDRFEIKYDCKYTDFHLSIFNRWGEKLWETNRPDDFWDGTYNGQPSPLGAYFWLATYTGPKNGVYAKFIQKGTITLIK